MSSETKDGVQRPHQMERARRMICMVASMMGKRPSVPGLTSS